MGPAADTRPATRVDESDPEIDSETASTAAGPSFRVHRLRDLGVRDRLIALALGLALLVAPASAAVRMFGTWTPSSDNALIELRARDVGTSKTPLVGQPSTSSQYGQRERNVAHPGPIEFYLLAPAERLIGGGVGMLTTTALISGISVVIAAWAVFRLLGPSAGLAAALALAAVMWTCGARVMVDPVSSSIGRFPLLCSVVLLWCLICGDVRLLALTCAVVSFTAQQHLSVVPTIGFVAAVGAVGLLVALVRNGTFSDRVRRREALRCILLAAAVSLILWAPVLYEQFTRSPGNVERILRYAGDQTRVSVGYGSALRQVAHALGIPPLLGRTNLTGGDLLAPVSTLAWATTLAAVALLITCAVLWRAPKPRLSALAVMALAVAVGGFLNGGNVPKSTEELRIAFYHWTFTLAFLELLVLLLAIGPVVSRRIADHGPVRPLTVRALAGPVVIIVVLCPAIANLFVSRYDNKIPLVIPKSAVDQIEKTITARREAVKGPTLLLTRGDDPFTGLYEAVAARLAAKNFDIVHRSNWTSYVNDDRIVDYRTVRSAILIVLGVGESPKVPGTLIGTANPAPGFDRRAFDGLIRQARSGSKVVLGPRLERKLGEKLTRPGLSALERKLFLAEERANRASLLAIADQPIPILAQPSMLRLLAEAPIAAPKLDHAALERVLRTYPSAQPQPLIATQLSVYLLNREQLLQYQSP